MSKLFSWIRGFRNDLRNDLKYQVPAWRILDTPVICDMMCEGISNIPVPGFRVSGSVTGLVTAYRDYSGSREYLYLDSNNDQCAFGIHRFLLFEGSVSAVHTLPYAEFIKSEHRHFCPKTRPWPEPEFYFDCGDFGKRDHPCAGRYKNHVSEAGRSVSFVGFVS